MLDFDLIAGKIIAFEGLDCSFKETNHNTFCIKLRDNVYLSKEYSATVNGTHCLCEGNIIIESFPRYGEHGAFFVEKWLQDPVFRKSVIGNNDVIDTFFSLDRYDYWYSHYDNIAYRPKTKNGVSGNYQKTEGIITNRYNLLDNKLAAFVFDRYASSNAIYNPLGGQRPQIEDFEFDNERFAIPKPDIVIWMRTGDFGVLTDLLAKKKNKDANELDLEFLERVWNNAEHAINNNLFQKSGIDLIVIDTLNPDRSIRSKESIADEIWYRTIAKLYEIAE